MNYRKYIQSKQVTPSVPLFSQMKMDSQRNRITIPELEQFVVADVVLTELNLGAGAYGSVEEVEIPGARVAAKKLHTQLITLGSPEQVIF